MWTDEEISAELRSSAAAGFVLARNEGSLLPLDTGSLRQVAVVGPNAVVARTLGGGSATVYPAHVVSPLDGLRPRWATLSKWSMPSAYAPGIGSRSHRSTCSGFRAPTKKASRYGSSAPTASSSVGNNVGRRR